MNNSTESGLTLAEAAKQAEAILGIDIIIVGDRAAHFADETRTGYWLTLEDLLYAKDCAQYGNDAYSHWCAGTGAPMSLVEARDAFGQEIPIEVIEIGTEFDLPEECTQDRDMEWYGTVRVRIEDTIYEVGAVIGVPESDRGSCRAAQSGVRPFLTAWYADSSDWNAVGIPQALCSEVIAAIAENAPRLWREVRS